MNVESELKKDGIEIIGRLDTLSVNSISKSVAEKICNTFPSAHFDCSQLFIEFSRTPMYIASMPEGYAEATYFYKNSSIYFKSGIPLKDLEKFAIHELIHHIQEVKDRKGNLYRLGLCEFGALKTYGTALNEGAVQLAASKILDQKETIVKLKKAYSMLSQSYMFAVGKYGTPDLWGMKTMNDPITHQIMAGNLSEFMKLTENCIGKDSDYIKKHCLASDTLSDTTKYASVVLADGTKLVFRNWYADCRANIAQEDKNNTCGEILVDYSTKKKLARIGYNRFGFLMTKDGIIPYGTEDGLFKFEKACYSGESNPYPSFTTGSNYACTAWVIVNENMDYLHCSGLSWSGKRTCKQ